MNIEITNPRNTIINDVAEGVILVIVTIKTALMTNVRSREDNGTQDTVRVGTMTPYEIYLGGHHVSRGEERLCALIQYRIDVEGRYQYRMEGCICQMRDLCCSS